MTNETCGMPDDGEIPGENCLEGMRCPNCGSYGPFLIEIKTTALVCDDGIEEYGDAEWDADSWCTCQECMDSRKVFRFRESDRIEEDENA